MKNSYRVQSNPEVGHNRNLTYLKSTEELLGIVGFCEPVFSTAECGPANEEEKDSAPQERTHLLHIYASSPEPTPWEFAQDGKQDERGR